jgi:hypothetical protein
MENEKENRIYPLELADILREGIDRYGQKYTFCYVQEKAVLDICNCRSKEAGGHIQQCNQCGYYKQSYNSCRNRHCPKCQYVKQEQWVDKLANTLIPAKYFHLVFTIPKELHGLFYINQRIGYNILFKASSLAFQKAGSNPQFLGAQTGALAVLHTWTQTLCYHPHIHMLAPAGGLSDDGIEWKNVKNKFFLPTKVLSRIFRGVIVRLLEESLSKGEIKLPERTLCFDKLKNHLYLKDWNVYLKKSFRGINSVLKYLGRYTHRVAISNSRLISFSEDKVSFWYKDNKDKGKRKVMALESDEFIRRFLQHILPDNFYKIRYIGILAMANAKTKKEQCISLIDIQMFLPIMEGLNAMEILGILTKKDFISCPKCQQGIMRVKARKPG